MECDAKVDGPGIPRRPVEFPLAGIGIEGIVKDGPAEVAVLEPADALPGSDNSPWPRGWIPEYGRIAGTA